MSQPRSDLVLVVAPVGRDAELMCSQLRAERIRCRACADVQEICGRIDNADVAAILLTEEALSPDAAGQLSVTLARQPAWSEIPLMILTGAPSIDIKPRSFDEFRRHTNVTLIDRPVRVASLRSTVRSALRSRDRQYEIRDLMAQLEERIHERDRFLAVLGHELRNPLGAILLASQMTDANGKLDGEHAQVIERQSRHLTRLVNDLLDLSRVAAGKIVLRRQLVSLEEVINQTLHVIAPKARKENVSIELKPAERKLLIDADPVRVDQILMNVLTNAVKYTPAGGHVRLTLSRDEDQAVIRVTDDGVGIAPERIDGIFELFAQAENAIGRAQGGMGIGLALVRNLVELHGGSVSAKSDGVGKGSDFAVRFPLASAESQIMDTTATKLREETAAAARRIVIVEDNSDVRDLLLLKLNRLGHQVSGASDGPEGVRLLLAEKPDLALVDLGLPGLDGFEVAREVRNQLGPEIVLVAVSGFGQPEDKRRALEAGFDEHITKPADVNDIENVLRRFPPRNSSLTDRV